MLTTPWIGDPVRAHSHLRLLALACGLWAAFWIAGLPDYYQQYPFAGMLAFSAALVPAIGLAAHRALRSVRPERRRARARWLAFYFTVPLLILDALYCGLHLGHGWAFLARYWYLTAFYVIPWIIFLPLARLRAGPRRG
jgi:hypothetical protein